MIRFFKKPARIFSLKQTNILSAAMVLMIMIFISSALGLLRNRLLAASFFSGQERLLDIYFAAFRLPDMIYQLLVLGALSAAFIPVFSEYLSKNSQKSNLVASSTINIFLFIYTGLAGLVFLAARPLSQVIAPSFSTQELDLMASILRIFIFAQGFFVLSGFMTGILQSYQRFLLPAVSAIVYNLSIIFGIIFLVPYFSIYGVVYGVLIGAIFHFLVQIPLVGKLGFRYSLSFSFRNAGVRKIFRLMTPRILSLAITQINLSVSIIIATSLSVGALTLYSFAHNIIALPVSLFGLTIGQASLPSLSQAASGNPKKFDEIFLQSFSQVLYLSLPASLVLIVLRIPMVRLVLGAKNFPWEATVLTGKLVAILALSIGLQSLIQLLIRFFYAKQDTKTPLWVNLIAVFANISIAWYLVFGLGWDIVALTIAYTISSFVQGLILIVLIRHRHKSCFDGSYLVYIGKILLINLLLGIVLWGLMRGFDLFLDTSKTINLVVLTIATLVVSFSLYIFLSYIFKIKEIIRLLQVFKHFGQWRQIFSQSEEILESQTGYE